MSRCLLVTDTYHYLIPKFRCNLSLLSEPEKHIAARGSSTLAAPRPTSVREQMTQDLLLQLGLALLLMEPAS